MADQFPGPTKMVLSPAAQAVLDAAGASEPGIYATIAAALRAAADQVVPHTAARTDRAANRRKVRAELLAIATELEAQ